MRRRRVVQARVDGDRRHEAGKERNESRGRGSDTGGEGGKLRAKITTIKSLTRAALA